MVAVKTACRLLRTWPRRPLQTPTRVPHRSRRARSSRRRTRYLAGGTAWQQRSPPAASTVESRDCVWSPTRSSACVAAGVERNRPASRSGTHAVRRTPSSIAGDAVKAFVSQSEGARLSAW